MSIQILTNEFSDDNYSWISWFCNRKGNEFFCEVSEDFLLDRFNLTGLSEMVIPFTQAYETIINDTLLDLSEYVVSGSIGVTEKSAELLYGLVHARYILTNEGILKMMEKFEREHFGTCPRTICNSQPMLPIGLSDAINNSSVKLYCPQCNDVYNPRSRYNSVDGAFFGTGFPHMFFMAQPHMRPLIINDKFEPRLYGFKIHHTAYDIQRESVREL